MFKFAKTLMMVGGLGLGLLAVNAPARADIIPQLEILPTPVGSEFLWQYDADLTLTQFLAAGDTFTIYDFAGFVPGSDLASDAGNWTFSSALLGPVVPGTTDNAGLPNLTWTYTGSTTGEGPIDLGTFWAKSIYGGQTIVSYSAMAHKYHLGFIDHATLTMNKGNTIAPETVVPEPGTMALLGLGAAPLLRRLRRRSRKA